MTAAAAAGRRAGSTPGPVRRARGLLGVEAVVEWRYRIPLVVGGLAAVWSGTAAMLPAGSPYLVFVETVTVGTFVIGALAVTERETGVRAALAVTPVRPAEYVGARVVPLGVLTTLAAVPVLLAGRLGAGQLAPGRLAGGQVASGQFAPGQIAPGRLALALGAVALTATLLLAIALGVAIQRRTFVGFLTAVPWPLLPLFGVPLAVAAGLLSGPAWYVVPTTGTLALLRDASGPPDVARAAPFPASTLLGYLALCALVAAWFAAWVVARPEAAKHRRAPARGSPPPEVRWRAGPRLSSFVRADLRNVTRDSMLAPVALSPLLLGCALRFGYLPLEEWLALTHGVALAPYRPLVALLAIVLHVPLTAGIVGAVFVLDDLDDGALRVVRVSPVGLGRYLAYRLGTVAAGAAVGLAVAAPLSGLVPVSAWGAVALAVPLAPVFTLSVLAVAGGRVEGITAVKPLGIPLYLPIAAWWITGPAGWALAPLPAFWAVRAWDAPGPVTLLAGMICAGLWMVPLARRVARRLAFR